ncbi:hypothetical protein OG778_30260 [Streptomyces sp. NBC_00184]|uniref:hypothetical protein n=1 Tax=Streptomyces sp. NBC_00184 TaxID=2975673 RepID=UPI002E2A12CE|nr:hypothetical protein [Streptomyces sp. NBC_00184]
MNRAADGVVHTRRERELAAGHWLLSASSDMRQSRADWRNKGAAWLQPGMLFGAVVVPEGLVHDALGLDGPDGCARPLAEHLEGGPLFYSPGGFGQQGSYTALVSASIAMSWRTRGSLGHHYRAAILIPSPHVTEPDGDRPWWVVPLDGPGVLCRATPLSALVMAGRRARDRPGGGTYA